MDDRLYTQPLQKRVSVPRLAVLGVLLGGLTVAAGPRGAVAALCLGFIWLFVPSYFVFGLGEIVFIAIRAGVGDLGVIGTQIGLWGVLAVDMVSTQRKRFAIELGFGSLSALGVIWIIQTLFDPLWQVVFVLCVLSAVCLYGFHRYQLVRMGLLGEAS
jgi:hypothetical protein